MAESIEYYRALAEGYQENLEKLLQPSVDALTIMGVLMSMLAEVEAFGAKNGQTDKYIASKERLLLLVQYANGNNTLANRNNTLRIKLKQAHSREYYLQKDLTELKTKQSQIDEFNKG